MATNKTRIKIRHGSTTPVTGTDGLLPYELGWDGTNLALYINNNGTIRKVGGEGLFLPLTGGTLYGNLAINKPDSCLYLKNPNMDTSTTTNSASTYNQIFFTDKSGRLNSFLQGVVDTTAKSSLHFGVRTQNSDNSNYIQQYFSIIMAKDGTASTYFTHPAAWRTGLGVPAMTTESYPALLPTNGTNNWIKIGTANTSYGLLPSQAGGAGSGHNSIGTSSWYWKNAYIDEMHGHLNGPADALNFVHTNELILGNDTSQSRIWFNYRRVQDGAASGNTAITEYRFCNGNAGTAGVTLYADSFTGNAATSSSLLYAAQKTTAADLDAFHTANQLSACIWSDWSDTDKASASYPGVSNGIILDGGYTNTTYGFQIAIDDDPTGFIALRQKNGNGWQAWNKILTLSDGNSAYVKKAGDTMTGNLIVSKAGDTYVEAKNTTSGCRIEIDVNDAGKHGLWSSGYYANSTYTASSKWILYRSTDGEAHTDMKLYGAVWNDYAEYRDTLENSKPGQCVIENGDDSLRLSTSRMQRAAHIVSDTFGFAIGKTDKCKTPVAVSGRVLAYIYEGRQAARGAIGRPVCSGPNGTVSIMTDEEYRNFGYCAIGTISAVPDYEKWGEKGEEVDVNGRIWIKVH